MAQRPVLVVAAARDPFVSELVQILHAEGCDVQTIHNPEAAQEAIRARQPAVVVLDAVLPGLDALSLCRQLKSDPETSEIPIFFFSVLMARDRCLEAGADDFMLKPIEQGLLLARIREVLNSRVTQLRRRAR